MSKQETIRMYAEELILNCIDEVNSEGAYFSAAYVLMSGGLTAAVLVQAVTAFEKQEICISILDSRLRYLENKGGEAFGI